MCMISPDMYGHVTQVHTGGWGMSSGEQLAISLAISATGEKSVSSLCVLVEFTGTAVGVGTGTAVAKGIGGSEAAALCADTSIAFSFDITVAVAEGILAFAKARCCNKSLSRALCSCPRNQSTAATFE